MREISRFVIITNELTDIVAIMNAEVKKLSSHKETYKTKNDTLSQEIAQLKSDLKSKQKVIDELNNDLKLHLSGKHKYMGAYEEQKEEVEGLELILGEIEKICNEATNMACNNLDTHEEMVNKLKALYQTEKAKATKANAEKRLLLDLLDKHRLYSRVTSNGFVNHILADYKKQLKQRRKKSKKGGK